MESILMIDTKNAPTRLSKAFWIALILKLLRLLIKWLKDCDEPKPEPQFRTPFVPRHEGGEMAFGASDAGIW
jgi:hypothetical protein